MIREKEEEMTEKQGKAKKGAKEMKEKLHDVRAIGRRRDSRWRCPYDQ